ncbi:hypothetical protein [Hyphomonas sp.]|jgi:hypothetical protein|uniref:hypothetical protein n=1 Tax=Hyphomonas sp. TaxID=87 RepID=UPI0025C1CB0F|nr:hypothetical protein [Hyphomonas sp.]
MKAIWVVVLAAGLGACAHEASGPKTVTELHQQHTWQHEPGAELQASMAKEFSRIAHRAGRAATIAQLAEAGYECTFGEAHEDYPEPAAVCTRSFASRACQFDWEVSLTSDPKTPDSVDETDTGFKRDCVGTGDDWPEPVKSAIDDQLAPMPDITETY